MEELELLATSKDPLLSCLMCKHLIHEAVQLKCLHNYCQKCFSAAASTVGSKGVSCIACGTITDAGSEQPNEFLNSQLQSYRAISESRMCGVCRDNGEPDKPALVWCPTCRHSLCGDCISSHRQYFRQHVTQSLEELSSLDEVGIQRSASACAVHKKPLEMACRNCEQPKCVTCAADCLEQKHEIYVAGTVSFDTYVGKLISSIASIESELLRKSEVLQKPKLRDTKVARDRHLEEVCMRKRRVVDAVEMIYQEIEVATKNAYDELEAERNDAAAVADRIEADLSDARSYIQRLVECDDKCMIINQQKIVRERLNVLSAQLDSLSKQLSTTMRTVKIEASLPDDVEDVVRAWIGMPRTCAESIPPVPSRSQLNKLQQAQVQQQQASSSPLPSEQQQQQESFFVGTAFKLPVHCYDVALTQDGRSLLLAAWQDGLIELNSTSGRRLNSWLPPKYSSGPYRGQCDLVTSVTALSNRHAAVSLQRALLVVLLQRSEKSSSSGSSAGTAAAAVAAAADGAGDDEWIEDGRIQMPWHADCLSAHGDVLAAREYCMNRREAQRLQLLSLSSRRLLSGPELKRDYAISCLAVAARLIVTGSRFKVELGGGRGKAHVLDAHSLDADGGSDRRLWRHVLSGSSGRENPLLQRWLLWGVCSDSSSGCLYAAVRMSDDSSGSVSALNLADGSELRRVALSFHSADFGQLRLPPRQLSLCDVGAAEQQQGSSSSSSSRRSGGRVLLLASLCEDWATREQTIVTLHRSTIDTLQ